MLESLVPPTIFGAPICHLRKIFVGITLEIGLLYSQPLCRPLPFIRSFIHPSTHPSVHLSIHSSMHSFIDSLGHKLLSSQQAVEFQRKTWRQLLKQRRCMWRVQMISFRLHEHRCSILCSWQRHIHSAPTICPLQADQVIRTAQAYGLFPWQIKGHLIFITIGKALFFCDSSCFQSPICLLTACHMSRVSLSLKRSVDNFQAHQRNTLNIFGVWLRL